MEGGMERGGQGGMEDKVSEKQSKLRIRYRKKKNEESRILQNKDFQNPLKNYASK